MATTVIEGAAAPKRYPGRRYDNIFFCVIVALLFATVLFGFARTYFLAGLVRAPLPNLLIHVHGAAFTCWMLLLIVQTGLVSARRVDIHRKLGLFGFGLACAMVILGLWAACDALARKMAPSNFPVDSLTFFAVPLGAIFGFAVLVFFAYRYRANSPVHKRLILLATIAMMDAAVNRWPVPLITQNHIYVSLVIYSFIVAIVLYDLWSTGKLNRATLWGGLFVIIVGELRVPIGLTGPFRAFAAWVQSLQL